jgi:hypothetical protein
MNKKAIAIYAAILMGAWIMKENVIEPKEIKVPQYTGQGALKSQDINPHSEEIRKGIEEWRNEADAKGDSLVMYGEY